MKTARQILEQEFNSFGDDELQLQITLNPDVKKIIKAMEVYSEQKLNIHGIMQGLPCITEKLDYIIDNMQQKPKMYVKKKLR
jgi:hypothetical protein